MTHGAARPVYGDYGGSIIGEAGADDCGGTGAGDNAGWMFEPAPTRSLTHAVARPDYTGDDGGGNGGLTL